MNTLKKLINDFSIQNLNLFLRKVLEGKNFKPSNDDLDHLFKEDIYDKYESIIKIGKAEIDKDELIVIASKTNEPLTERTGKKNQYEIAKTILKDESADASLFIFYDDEGNFRFSYIQRNWTEKGENKYSTFKRYTYFVSPSQTNRTFIKQIDACNFNSLDEIIQAFSVEPLNKQFYQDIAKYFYGLIGGKVKIASKNEDYNTLLKLPSKPVETNRKVYQEFAVRLIGRTIFCWFLKSKKSENSIPLVPKTWLSSKRVIETNKEQHSYYHTVLEKLFFLVLNKKQEDRKDYDLAKDHELIPFLNGGLFEAQTDDFFPKNNKGIHQISYNLDIPNQWFIDLFKTLEQYNFTIDENSIYDAEVSIDPEMLGTIFENLLAEIDPDTEKSARKATGSFYTPREIVDYMVEQSLVQYLKTKVETKKEEQLLELFKEGGENQFEPLETNKILEALSDVKILDPACGSGAFPMGALHKIIIALQKLDPDASWWKKQQIDNASPLLKEFLRLKLTASTNDYARKLGVIQNSIYGVDIQPIAAEISKLRCFLSLVIDEKIIDNEDNRGIWALPNLEFKFVTANTLIGLEDEKNKLDFDQKDELQDLLKTIRSQYLQAYGDDKIKLKQEFEDLQLEIFKRDIGVIGSRTALQSDLKHFKETQRVNKIDLSKKIRATQKKIDILEKHIANERAQQLASWKPFSNESNDWFDPEWMYGVEKFDIVIGNPPYSVFQGKSKKDLIPLMKNNIYDKAKGGKINAYELFLCRTPLLLNTEGINCQIFQNSFLADNAAAGVRKYYLSEQQIISIDSYPERDDPKKRVFENVKMSVCILLNKNTINKDYYFDVNFWNNKIKSSGKHITYNNKEIIKFNDQALIYNLNNEEKVIFEKYFIDNKTKYSEFYKCLEGELNMTFHKDYLIDDKTSPLVVKGAQVQRYFITNNPSQGAVEYVDKNRYLLDYSRSKKSKHYKKMRIAMQGITGANDKIRIVSTLIDKNIFLANSCNYIITISNEVNYSIYFLLGIFNSKFTNWIFRRSSTNSNVNCYEVNNLKLPNLNEDTFQRIENLALLCNSQSKTKIYENEIDILVYKLYKLDHTSILIIDPNFKLTKEEYDNYQID